MKTIVNRKEGKEVMITDEGPTVLIGEGINPTGRKKVVNALKEGNWEVIKEDVTKQVEAGADVLDVNVSMADAEEADLLPQVIKVVMDTVDIPLCIDTSSQVALEAALEVYEGRPIVNSVTGEESSLSTVLPLVKKYDAAVIGLAMDEEGIQNDPEKRAAVARKIVERAESEGIPPENVIIDCLTLTIGTDTRNALITLEAIKKVKQDLGVNMTLGISNISFGMPDRELLNSSFLSMAIQSGVTCPIADAGSAKPVILATDLLLGRDRMAERYIADYRKRQK
ncbi:MAG: dihydropteroate synthase [Archaeoglobaceae archaeon]